MSEGDWRVVHWVRPQWPPACRDCLLPIRAGEAWVNLKLHEYECFSCRRRAAAAQAGVRVLP